MLVERNEYNNKKTKSKSVICNQIVEKLEKRHNLTVEDIKNIVKKLSTFKN